MSLQVWLPLNETMENQGLDNITVTNNGATIDNNGKIGKCYLLNGSNNYITGTYDATQNISFCAWIYFPTVKSAHVLDARSSDSVGYQPMYITTSSIQIGCAGTSYETLSYTFTANTWYHICVTHTETTGNCYINGVRIGGTATSKGKAMGASTFTIGTRWNKANYSNIKINDFRIYDHALSAKEVKELSKGLVLHYKLDGKDETTTNLVTTEDCLSSTAYNASVNKYGYNADSNLAKTVGDFNGKHCTKVTTITAGVSARPYVYFANLFTSNGTNQPAYKTLSFDYYGTIGTYVNFYKLGSGSGTGTWKNITLGQSGSWTNSGNIIVEPNKWNHIELTLHGTTDANAEFGYCILGDTHTTAASNYWLFANGQLEIKDHATPYVGVGGSRTYTTEYDCSGYGYNGTPIGGISYSNDTIRYKKSLSLNGTDGAIQTPNLSTIITDNRTYSISCWFKKSSIGTKNYQTIYGGPSGFELEARNGGGTDPQIVAWNWGKPIAVYTFNTWNHLVFVHTNDDCKIYLNGTYVSTGSAVNIPSGNYFIGAWNNSVSQNYEGQLNDFRIYATALSADDVKELYQTSASIGNDGTIYAYELEEV